jgi:hypothetical protein
MSFKLIESAQARWRAVNPPHFVALVRAGARFENANSSNDPRNQEVINSSRETPIHRSLTIPRQAQRVRVLQLQTTVGYGFSTDADEKMDPRREVKPATGCVV